jgi:hypothetical protein
MARQSSLAPTPVTASGTIIGCRSRFTCADGIHLDSDCNYDTIENCHVRGAGDDAIALLSDTNTVAASCSNSVIYNTVAANWNASNFDLAGGTGNLIAYNFFADSGGDASFVINFPWKYVNYAVTGATISGNYILRGGGNATGQKRGAIFLFPQVAYPSTSPAITNVTFNGNYIENSLWSEARFSPGGSTQSTSVQFNNNVFNGTMNPPGDGIDIDSAYVGTGTFTNNTVILSGTGIAYKNSGTATFTGTGSGNNSPAFSFP